MTYEIDFMLGSVLVGKCGCPEMVDQPVVDVVILGMS